MEERKGRDHGREFLSIKETDKDCASKFCALYGQLIPIYGM